MLAGIMGTSLRLMGEKTARIIGTVLQPCNRFVVQVRQVCASCVVLALLLCDVSAPALQARFALGGEQFVFVQDAQRDVVNGIEPGRVAARLKSGFGGVNGGKIAANLVQHQRLSAHDDDDQQQTNGATVAVCRLVQQGGEDDKSADERGAGFERRGFGRIRRLRCHCRAPCCG